MATISTHTLSAVDGTHAGSVAVKLVRIGRDGSRSTRLTGATDAHGRFSQEVALSPGDDECEYELVFGSGDYFAVRGLPRPGAQIVGEVVIRFTMPDPNGRYHIPVILAPNGYSVWWSS